MVLVARVSRALAHEGCGLSATLHHGHVLDVLAPRKPNGQFVKGTHWRARKPHWDAEWLRVEYVERQRSTSEIGGQVGVGDTAIAFWLKKHGIPTRTMAEVRAAKHWGVTGPANPMFGKFGPASPNYVDGSAPERQRLYSSGHGKEFRAAVLARDGYRCRRCSAPKTGPKSLHVHHIKPWAGNPALRLDAGNAATLCAKCHRWVHGKGNTTKEWLA